MDKYTGLFLLLLGLAILYGSAKLGLGTAGSPGPGFLSFWGGAVLLVTSTIQFVSALASTKGIPGEPPKPLFERGGLRKVVYVIAALLIYTVFLESIGYIVCTFLLMFFLLAVIEARRWHVLLVETLLVTLLSYVVFEKALIIGFPRGLWGF
jgi:putative tricarboxylic transport membrane protein